MADVKRHAVTIVLEVKTPVTMSVVIVTWAVTQGTKLLCVFRVSGLLNKMRQKSHFTPET